MDHLKNTSPKIISCWHGCTFFIYFTCLHLTAFITQSSVLIKSQYIIFYCNETLKTMLEVHILLHCLCDILHLVKYEQQIY